MLRLLVGDECNDLRVQVTIGHWETVYGHSEPFGKLKAGSAKKATLCHPEPFDRLRINSAKDLEILRCPAVGGTPQNDIQMPGCRMDAT